MTTSLNNQGSTPTETILTEYAALGVSFYLQDDVLTVDGGERLVRRRAVAAIRQGLGIDAFKEELKAKNLIGGSDGKVTIPAGSVDAEDSDPYAPYRMGAPSQAGRGTPNEPGDQDPYAPFRI